VKWRDPNALGPLHSTLYARQDSQPGLSFETAAILRTAWEFVRSDIANFDKLSPVKGKEDAGPQRPASFLTPDQDGRSADRLVSSTGRNGCGTQVRRRRNRRGMPARGIPLLLYARQDSEPGNALRCWRVCSVGSGCRLGGPSRRSSPQMEKGWPRHPFSICTPYWTTFERR